MAASLGTIEDVIAHKAELEAGWIAPATALGEKLSALADGGEGKARSGRIGGGADIPDARTGSAEFVAGRARAERQASAASARGQDVYKAYCDAMEEQLGALYAAVEGDFSTYYRDINSDDEGAFKARLEPSEGKLDLEVAFYDKGMFPPAAYHSEGHQDGMGVCLYLALMKRVLGERFTLRRPGRRGDVGRPGAPQAVLHVAEDAFSRDAVHHHDARQGLGEADADRRPGRFQRGHRVSQLERPDRARSSSSSTDVWDQIDADLAKNDMSCRRRSVCGGIWSTSPPSSPTISARSRLFRGDFSYDLGDLLSGRDRPAGRTAQARREIGAGLEGRRVPRRRSRR